MLAFLLYAKKAGVYIAGMAVEALATGVLDGVAEKWAQGIVALATLAGIYQARNADSPGGRHRAPDDGPIR